MVLRPGILEENLGKKTDRNLARQRGVRGLEGRAGHMPARYLTVMCWMPARCLAVMRDMTVRYLAVMSGGATGYPTNTAGYRCFSNMTVRYLAVMSDSSLPDPGRATPDLQAA